MITALCFVEEENSYNIKSCTFVEYIIQKQNSRMELLVIAELFVVLTMIFIGARVGGIGFGNIWYDWRFRTCLWFWS